jgi:hypothetical protein
VVGGDAAAGEDEPEFADGAAEVVVLGAGVLGAGDAGATAGEPFDAPVKAL